MKIKFNKNTRYLTDNKITDGLFVTLNHKKIEKNNTSCNIKRPINNTNTRISKRNNKVILTVWFDNQKSVIQFLITKELNLDILFSDYLNISLEVKDLIAYSKKILNTNTVLDIIETN